VRRGVVDPSQRVVVVLTGHVLKDPGALLQYHREMDPPPPGANRPVEIEPKLSEVEAQLKRAR
jgi:threonine synthase